MEHAPWDYLTSQLVARILGVSQRHLQRMVRTGEIRALNRGRGHILLFESSEVLRIGLKRWLAGQHTAERRRSWKGRVGVFFDRKWVELRFRIAMALAAETESGFFRKTRWWLRVESEFWRQLVTAEESETNGHP